MILEIIGQAVGIVAMAFNVLSFQAKNSKGIILFQFFGGMFFSINFLLIGSYIGAMLNFLGMLRALFFAFRDKWHISKTLLTVVFCVLFVSTYPILFTVFSKPFSVFNAIIEIIPVCSMILSTFAYGVEAKKFRILALIYSPMWLAYNIVVFSIGAIISETLCIISAIVALIRYKRKEDNVQNKNGQTE